MNPMKLIAVALMLVCVAAPATGQPRYEVVKTTDAFEVRTYEPYVVAEAIGTGATDDAAERAFSMLAGYIYGQNMGDQKFEMSAPVTQMRLPSRSDPTMPSNGRDSGDELLVQFMMPKTYDLSALPEPTDPRVKLREVPSQKYAVIRYSGSWFQSNYEEHLEILKKALAQAGMSVQGEPVFARYDPVFTLWIFRTNEIWLKLE